MEYVWFAMMVIGTMFAPLVVSHETTFGLVVGICMAVMAAISITRTVISVRRSR